MAYEPNVWKCGDTITADQLNRLEQAVAELSQGGGESSETLIIRQQDTQEDQDRLYYDKTFNEVYEALANGQRVFEIDGGLEDTSVSQTVITCANANDFVVYKNHEEIGGSEYLTADSADGYLYKAKER